MPAYAAIANESGNYVFFGGEPLAEVDIPQNTRAQKECAAPSGDDFAPSFISGKISGLRMSLTSTKECMMKSPLSKYYSFSVNDCSRKIHAKNEKRRNRKQKQLFKEMVYAS